MGVAAALPLIATAVAAGAQYYNTRQTAKRQDATLAEGIRQQAATQRRGNESIQQALSDIATSSPSDEVAANRAEYNQAIRGTERMASAGQALSGLSEAYDQAARGANTAAAGRTGTVADLLSRIDAPLQQRQAEGFRTGDLRTNLSVLGREASGQDYLARLRAQGIRRNPFIDAFAQGLQGYAAGAGGGTGSSIGGVTKQVPLEQVRVVV